MNDVEMRISGWKEGGELSRTFSLEDELEESEKGRITGLNGRRSHTLY